MLYISIEIKATKMDCKTSAKNAEVEDLEFHILMAYQMTKENAVVVGKYIPKQQNIIVTTIKATCIFLRFVKIVVPKSKETIRKRGKHTKNGARIISRNVLKKAKEDTKRCYAMAVH